MNLDLYISELLFTHNCVIIPEFGGFVANYAPAKIHPVKHTITPPSKKVAFNVQLQNNDGLLASFVASKERISYADAVNKISLQVEEFKSSLKKNKAIVFEQVGSLYLDIEKNIQFKSDDSMNYLLDAFGLVEIQSPAIKRDNLQERIEKQFMDRAPIALTESAPKKRFPWKLVAPVPFIALVVWGSLTTDLFSRLNNAYSDLSPISYTESHKVSSLKNEKPVETTPEIFPSVNNEESIPVVTAETEPIKEAVVAPVAEKKATPSVSSNPVTAAELNNEHRFFIVAGCFKSDENAANYVKQLNLKGFDAFIKGKNPAGLNVVVYGGYSLRQDAVAALSKIKAEADSNAWLMAN